MKVAGKDIGKRSARRGAVRRGDGIKEGNAVTYCNQDLVQYSTVCLFTPRRSWAVVSVIPQCQLLPIVQYSAARSS